MVLTSSNGTAGKGASCPSRSVWVDYMTHLFWQKNISWDESLLQYALHCLGFLEWRPKDNPASLSGKQIEVHDQNFHFYLDISYSMGTSWTNMRSTGPHWIWYFKGDGLSQSFVLKVFKLKCYFLNLFGKFIAHGVLRFVAVNWCFLLVICRFSCIKTQKLHISLRWED